MENKIEDKVIYILGFINSIEHGYHNIENILKQRYFEFHRELSKEKVKNLSRNFNQKEETRILINQCISKLIERYEPQEKFYLIQISKSNLERYYQIIYGHHQEIFLFDYIEAKEKMLLYFSDDFSVPNHIRNALVLTNEEVKKKLFYESNIVALKASWDRYKFIDSFSRILNMLVYINESSFTYNNLISALDIKKEKSRFDFLPFKKEKTLFQNISPISDKLRDRINSEAKKSDHNNGNSWKRLLNISKQDVLNTLLEKENNSSTITSLIGACSELANTSSSIAILCTFVFEEFEKIAVCFLKQCETNQDIPILSEQIVNHTETGYDKPTNIYYKALEYISQNELSDAERKINHSFDFNPDGDNPLSTISKKDLVVVVQEIIKSVQRKFIDWPNEEFNTVLQYVTQIIELKWLLGINTPKDIYSLKNGNLFGSKENRLNVEDKEFFILICKILSHEVNKPFEEIKNYLRPFVNIRNEANEDHHNNYDRYSTSPIENPSPVLANFDELIKKIEHIS